MYVSAAGDTSAIFSNADVFASAPALAARVHYVQGDLRRLPIRDQSFDFVHSSGVLHHPPSTAEAFRLLR